MFVSASPPSDAWTRTPVGLLVHLPVTSQDGGSLPAVFRRSASHDGWTATSVQWFDFGAAVIRFASGLRICLPPWSLPPCTGYRRAAVASTFELHTGSLPPLVSNMLVARTGQLATGDFNPMRLAALPAAPKTKNRKPVRSPPAVFRCRGGPSVQSDPDRYQSHCPAT